MCMNLLCSHYLFIVCCVVYLQLKPHLNWDSFPSSFRCCFSFYFLPKRKLRVCCCYSPGQNIVYSYILKRRTRGWESKEGKCKATTKSTTTTTSQRWNRKQQLNYYERRWEKCEFYPFTDFTPHIVETFSSSCMRKDRVKR